MLSSKTKRSGNRVRQALKMAAMREHMRFRSRPDLVKRVAVGKSSESENTTLVGSVVKSLSGFRSRLAQLVH